jgi:OTU domain-containing protein 6
MESSALGADHVAAAAVAAAAVEGRQQMASRHKRELQQLRSKGAKERKALGKKKKAEQRDIDRRYSRLENELKKRHAAETDAASLHWPPIDVAAEAAAAEASAAVAAAAAANLDACESKPRKLGKSARRRLRKAAEAEERRNRNEASFLFASKTSARTLELERLAPKLAAAGLAIFDVASDGHCLYRSVAHQLKQHGVTLPSIAATVGTAAPPHVVLRALAAAHMRSHADDFSPFLEVGDGESASVVLERRCVEIESTAAWGGHLEVQALASALMHPITVVNADGPSTALGAEWARKGKVPLTLVFHRHLLALGEHYNSCVPLQ